MDFAPVLLGVVFRFALLRRLSTVLAIVVRILAFVHPVLPGVVR